MYERISDFFRADVLAVSDDDVLLAPGDRDVITIYDPAEVAHIEEAVFIESALLVLRAQIANQHLRTPREDLPLLPERRRSGQLDLRDADAPVGLRRVLQISRR